ncbi:MAG: pyridoxamine 5'-phosphate oxidase family protein [Herpetosiphonaceae bacterium]|nr:pyridoxamine 5'-phosphate oxidase family protein [Herpetosiphonaceae bacterium]
MGAYFSAITAEQAALIRNAPLFFVATADPQLAHDPHSAGALNMSPKGGIPLHILSPQRIAYLDYKGSGNETARHLAAGGPMVVMVCSFEAEQAAIVRLYGTGRLVDLADAPGIVGAHEAHDHPLPLRQVIELDIHTTMTSCGYGVPVMTLLAERQRSQRGRRYKTYPPPASH